jgi:hypothetical protein
MKPIDSMIKECDEEASLPEAFVKKYMKYADYKSTALMS